MRRIHYVRPRVARAQRVDFFQFTNGAVFGAAVGILIVAILTATR